MATIPPCPITLYNESHHKLEIFEIFEELKFIETCCTKTIRKGLHLFLSQYILKIRALFQMLFHTAFPVMTSTICAGLRYYFLLQ